ncbi:Acid-sensing ion channel 3 [Amphibalanus amphitrite]|uniref:Acid-sensing ion channel 3 n=1 Tax=Amphibalanus amphitrite TaxID=1232801 RepID=A0A6A4VMV7_AMPAM|nr:Acid-sensing ion channel 3 [Amphibalanus amphitrite]
MLERACRAVYALAELLCVIGLLVLCVLKVQHFLSHPVSTTVSYQPSRPPAITVCHQLVDEQAVGELENQFWIEYSDTLNLCLEISKLLQQTKLAVEDFQTRPDVSNETDSSPDAIQYVVYKIMLHAAPVPLLDAPSGLRERSFEIFNNQDWVEVDVRMEELRSLNRKSRPCEEDPAYSRGRCLSECQAAAHAREAGCQLEAVWPATAQGLPQCETATQLERLRAELAAPPSCACPRPCRQGRVSAVVQASSRTASDHEVTVTVRVDGDMQVIEESAAYTAGSLLTDFGGNMGLTMGFSLLTIVELLKKITFGCLDRRI